MLKTVSCVHQYSSKTSAYLSLNKVWYLFIMFLGKIYLQWNARILSVHLLRFHECIHLCDSNTYKDTEHYHHLTKFPRAFSRSISVAPSIGNHCFELVSHRTAVLECYIKGIVYTLLCEASLTPKVPFFEEFVLRNVRHWVIQKCLPMQ